MLIQILILIFGFVVLIKGADKLRKKSIKAIFFIFYLNIQDLKQAIDSDRHFSQN